MNNEAVARINWLERQILVHSYLYYELDKAAIEDDEWAEMAVKLEEYIEKYPDEFQVSQYAKSFTDFDHSSGYNLRETYMHSRTKSAAKYLLDNPEVLSNIRRIYKDEIRAYGRVGI